MLSSFNNGDVFRLSVSVMNSQTWTILSFRQYTFSVCLFVFIPFSCSWVTKYLECESLCSSCTRTEIIAMIIKKNMTKLYMHHCCGGLVYCCIVTHEKCWFVLSFFFFLLLRKKTISQKTALFCALCALCARLLLFCSFLASMCAISNITRVSHLYIT